MNNREAIEILDHNWTKLVNPDYSDEELGEAQNLAIKALSEPTIPLSVIEKIHTEVGNLEWYGDDAFWDGVNAVTSIIDKAVKECTHE